MPNEITVYEKFNDPFQAAEKLGDLILKSEAFGVTRSEQAALIAFQCICTRRDPFELMRQHHLIKGKFSLKSEVMLGRLRKAGGKHKVKTYGPDKVAVEITSPGETEPTLFELSWQDMKEEEYVYEHNDSKDRSKRTGLKERYATPHSRTQMLWARLVSNAVRVMAPEILDGEVTPEEVEDSTPSITAPELKLAKVESVTTIPVPAANPVVKSSEETIAQQARRERKERAEKNAEAAKAQAAESSAIPAPDSETTPEPPKNVVTMPSPSTAVPETKPIDKVNVPGVGADGKLNGATVVALENAIGSENLMLAGDWLVARGWIKGSLAEMSVERANNILTKTAIFIEAVKKTSK